MLAALAVAFALQAPPPPPVTHHFVLHTGGHADVTVHANVRSWSNAHPNVASFSQIHRVKNASTMRLTATTPGKTAITVGCDAGHQEVWLVDVR